MLLISGEPRLRSPIPFHCKKTSLSSSDASPSRTGARLAPCRVIGNGLVQQLKQGGDQVYLAHAAVYAGLSRA